MKPNHDELPLETLIGKPIAIYCDGKLIRSFQGDPQKQIARPESRATENIEKNNGGNA